MIQETVVEMRPPKPPTWTRISIIYLHNQPAAFIWCLYFCSHIILFKNYLLFLLALGLHYCAWASSICSEQGYSLLLCVGFSLQWHLLLGSTGSGCVGFSSHGAQLRSCGSLALERRQAQ